jgi:heat shock factor-binding protein 1
MIQERTHRFNLLTVMQMSNRVDALEAAIQDIISGDVTTPSASSPLASVASSVSGVRRSGSSAQ